MGQTFRDAGSSGIEFFKADLSLMKEALRVAHLLHEEILDLVILLQEFLQHQNARKQQKELKGAWISYLSRLVIVRDIAPRLGKQRTDKKMKPRVFIMGFPGTMFADLFHWITRGHLQAAKGFQPQL